MKKRISSDQMVSVFCFAKFVFLVLVMVEWLFLAVPQGCMRFVIVVFPDHTHLLFLKKGFIFLFQQGSVFKKGLNRGLWGVFFQ